MGDPDEIADLHVVGDIEAQKVFHSGFAERLRGQSRAEKCGQTSRSAAHYDSLCSKARMYFISIFRPTFSFSNKYPLFGKIPRNFN